MLSIIAVIAVIAAVLIGWLATDRLVNETSDLRDSTGQVLIANQSILASLAEADTAAAAVHLAGAEGDRVQRRVYEQALERAGSELEGVAASLGDDEESHRALQRVGAALTRYSGQVEAARLASVEGLPGANDRLADAITTVRSDITPELQTVSANAEDRFTDEVEAGWYLTAVLVFLVPLLLLIVAQYFLFRKFHRFVNLPLLLATIVLGGVVVWMLSAWSAQQDALSEARGGAYEAIATSADLQAAAFAHRAEATGAVISDRIPDLDVLENEVKDLLLAAESEADSTREVAAAEAMKVRWDRYVAATDPLVQALAGGDTEQARSVVRNESNSAFTGFNTSVEGALFDNRTQFDSAVGRASSALDGLRLALIIGGALAALLTWFGFAQRIREYR